MSEEWLIEIPVEKVRPGTTFKLSPDRRASTYQVVTVDRWRCKHHTHVNDNACYENGTMVWVRPGDYFLEMRAATEWNRYAPRAV